MNIDKVIIILFIRLWAPTLIFKITIPSRNFYITARQNFFTNVFLHY